MSWYISQSGLWFVRCWWCSPWLQGLVQKPALWPLPAIWSSTVISTYQRDDRDEKNGKLALTGVCLAKGVSCQLLVFLICLAARESLVKRKSGVKVKVDNGETVPQLTERELSLAWEKSVSTCHPVCQEVLPFWCQLSARWHWFVFWLFSAKKAVLLLKGEDPWDIVLY